MGRRSLPKVDPKLDLAGYLLTVEDLPRPWSTAALFGREAPLEIEVGSGKGLFMASAASAYPQHNFLGIEVAKKYARFAASKLAKRELTSAKMMAGDALPVFQDFLPDNSLAAVHVYFPDPWWKARHKKRRVLNEQFLRNVERVLVPGGTLHFWTDVEEYFQTTLALVPQVTKLTGPHDVAELAPEHDLDYRTHFERRMRLHGEAVYRSEFRKA